MLELGAWLLAACGVVVVGVGVFFVVLRPPLLPEDLKYLDTTRELLDAALPGLGRWLQKVFWVMGGYVAATGVLTVHLALTGVRDGSTTAVVVAGAAGAASVFTPARATVSLPVRVARLHRLSADAKTSGARPRPQYLRDRQLVGLRMRTQATHIRRHTSPLQERG